MPDRSEKMQAASVASVATGRCDDYQPGPGTSAAESTRKPGSETPAAESRESVAAPPAGQPGSKLSGWFHWHEPGTSAEEKRLILKLDWFLLSYSCLCFFVKYLDSNNVTNAYASGMQEELGFGPGNELSWMNTFFNIGQLVGAPFANLIITVVRPRYWLPFCLTCWSLFVLFLYKCNAASEFYALRFCIGLFESAAWPGIEYTLGSWYRKSELARRSALFVISGVLGQMFSGYLQAALFSGMEGHGGMSAWRWLFIFDFVLGIPVAIYGIVSVRHAPGAPRPRRMLTLSPFSLPRSSATPILPTTRRPGTSASGSARGPASASKKRAGSRPARWTGPCLSASSPVGRSTPSPWVMRFGP